MNPSAGGSGLVLHQIRYYSRRMPRGHRPSMRCPQAVWGRKGLESPCINGFQKATLRVQGEGAVVFTSRTSKVLQEGRRAGRVSAQFPFPVGCRSAGRSEVELGCEGQLCPPPVSKASWSLVLAAQRISHVNALFWFLVETGVH